MSNVIRMNGMLDDLLEQADLTRKHYLELAKQGEPIFGLLFKDASNEEFHLHVVDKQFVVRNVTDKFLEVEWFSWLTGELNGMGTISLDHAKLYVSLYSDHDEFLKAADSHSEIFNMSGKEKKK